MTPEEIMESNMTRIIEFWKDYKSWMPKDKLIEKYRGQISYEELLERFIGLYIANQKLKDKVAEWIKVLSK